MDVIIRVPTVPGDWPITYCELPVSERAIVPKEFAIGWLLNQYTAAILDGGDTGSIRERIIKIALDEIPPEVCPPYQD